MRSDLTERLMHHGSGFAIGARKVERSAGGGSGILPCLGSDAVGVHLRSGTGQRPARDAAPACRTSASTTVRDLVARHYSELCVMAAQSVARLCPGRRIPARALVRDTFLRLSCDRTTRFDGRFEFLCTATRVMQDLLAERMQRTRGRPRPALTPRKFLRIVDPSMGPPQRLQFEEALDFLMP